MLKKFFSTATSVILLVTGLSVIAAIPASANSNANLSALEWYAGGPSPTLIANFNQNTTSYSLATQNPSLKFYSTSAEPNRPRTRTCNNVVIPDDNTSCVFVPGANIYEVTVVAPDNVTTKTYTVTITYTPPVAPVITSTSTITAGQVNPTIVIETDVGEFANFSNALLASYNGYNVNVGTTGLTRGASVVSGAGNRILTVAFSGTASAGTLTFRVNSNVLVGGQRPQSNTLSFVVAGGSAPSQTAEQIAAAAAAAAQAAAQAAAVARAAEIANAQTALATVLRSDKAGSLSEYRAANINITTTAALNRLNAEVLKLSAADRADFLKIKAIADKIEFDESFFNASARPTIATYSTYGITGVTERILPVINAKVLELPAALRADVKAMQELVNVESFVDRVANPLTRSTVSAAALTSRGLLVADYPRRHSVVAGLASYPEGSLNTMAKIESAIKEQMFLAEAPKRRLAEIKAKIEGRRK